MAKGKTKRDAGEPAEAARPRVLTDKTLAVAELAALAALKPKPGIGGDELIPGEYVVDFTVHVQGVIVKLADEHYTPTAEIPLKRALAFVLQFAGLSGEAALAALTKAMQRAVRKDEDVDLSIVDRATDLVQASLDALPTKVRSGKVVLASDLIITRRG